MKPSASCAPAAIRRAACAARVQTGCVVAYQTVASEEPESLLLLLRRGVYWNEAGYLEALDSRPAICVNPLTGAAGGGGVDEKASLGATNATGLEWGTPPALIPHKVSARCLRGLLTVDKPSSPAFKGADTWEGARKVNSYNLFYGDIEADAQARLGALLGRPGFGQLAPPLDGVVEIGRSPVHRAR